MFRYYRAILRNPKWAALWAAAVLLGAFFTVPREGEDPAAALMPAAAEPAAEPAPAEAVERSEPVDPWALED